MISATTLPVRILTASTLVITICLGARAEHGPATSAASSAVLAGVSIGRDAHGVAHVFASSDEGAYYGAGYAAAQDRLFQICWMRLAVRGRVSEFFGSGAVVNPQTGAVNKTHIASDRKARLFGWSKHAQRAVNCMDLPTLKLLQSYADGVNAWMQDPNLVLDPLFTQYAIALEPWTPADCIGAWLRFGEFFGSNGLDEAKLLHDWKLISNTPGRTRAEQLEELLGALVCDDSAAVIERQDVPLALQDMLGTYARTHALLAEDTCLPYNASPHFSQAWAVDGAHTTTGRSVLVGDPRIGVTLPSQLYEWSMQGASFAVRGVGVPGCPNILSGSTKFVAWSPTAIGLDQSDLMQLTVNPLNQPGRYKLDGQWLDFAASNLETIHVLGEADVLVQYRETYWGPVVTGIVPDIFPGEEYAVRRVPFDDPFKDTSSALLNMYRAGSVDSFFDTLEGWTWPSVNLVFSDESGRVGYSVAGSVPVRNPALELAGVIAQDGSRTNSDWLDLLPHALVPHVIDPAAGFVFSANHRPVGSWYPIPIRFGSGGSGDTFRSRRLRELLTAASQQLISPQQISDMHHDVVSVAGRDLSEIGLWLKNHGVALSLDAKRALQELGPWYQAGANVDNSVRGTLVVWFLNLSFRLQDAGPELISIYGGGETGLNLFLKQALAKIRNLPPIQLRTTEIAYVDRVLSDAVRKAQLVGPTTVWQSWYQQNVQTVHMPRWTSLEGFPSLTPGPGVLMGPFRAADNNTLLSPLRQSYTQFVELGSRKAQLSVAPPGVAEPVSAHDLDQAILWQSEQLKYSPLTQAELEQLGPVQWTLL